MILNRLFDPLWLDSNVTLRGCGRTVLQQSLHQCNVMIVLVVDLCCVPFAEAIDAASSNSSDHTIFIQHFSETVGLETIFCKIENLQIEHLVIKNWEFRRATSKFPILAGAQGLEP